MSDERLVNDASASTMGTVYHFLVALQKCFEMISGQAVAIEKFGDVTINAHQQVEVKHYSEPLTDNHPNFWKTLRNWMDDAFDPVPYASLRIGCVSRDQNSYQLEPT